MNSNEVEKRLTSARFALAYAAYEALYQMQVGAKDPDTAAKEALDILEEWNRIRNL